MKKLLSRITVLTIMAAVLTTPYTVIYANEEPPVRDFTNWVVIRPDGNHLPVQDGTNNNSNNTAQQPSQVLPVSPSVTLPTPTAPIQLPTMQEDRVVVPVLFDEPTLLTSAELIALAETAPTHEDTRSAIVLPDRILTDVELQAWIEEYKELGGINAFELEVVRLINEARDYYYGLPPLKISMELSMAARFHNQEMLDLGYFAHISPNTGTSNDRAIMFGHITGAFENLGGFIGMMNSPGHRAGIMHCQTVTM